MTPEQEARARKARVRDEIDALRSIQVNNSARSRQIERESAAWKYRDPTSPLERSEYLYYARQEALHGDDDLDW